MSNAENNALVRDLYDSFNRKDANRLQALTEEDAPMRIVPFNVRASVEDVWRMWAEAFPDGQVEDIQIDSDGDEVTTHFHGRGTHSGTLRLEGREIPPTGRKVELTFDERYQIRDGKIVSGEARFDADAFFQQLGLSPPAAGQSASQPESPAY